MGRNGPCPCPAPLRPRGPRPTRAASWPICGRRALRLLAPPGPSASMSPPRTSSMPTYLSSKNILKESQKKAGYSPPRPHSLRGTSDTPRSTTSTMGIPGNRREAEALRPRRTGTARPASDRNRLADISTSYVSLVTRSRNLRGAWSSVCRSGPTLATSVSPGTSRPVT